MMKNTFIPNWYIDKKNKIGNKKIKICIMVTIILNIVLLSLIFNTYHGVSSIKGKIAHQKMNINVPKGVKGTEVVKKDTTSIELYSKLSKFLVQNNLNCKNIIITKTNLEMEIEVKSYDEYIVAIECIENNYSIKKLTSNNKNKGNFNFEVIIEV
ncbi:hypothetical protein [Clostridium psychrophilum]|uniref:hypothetical protein n=1 Tax=Clostridium psychrophilum TaxID=132926 RepID=UPI001C0CB247|nr:hypothetical protein [Clostridium psychrophilum]MBU3180142.1 hypothetical protein [Clostridium psychrophilum]